MAAGADGQKSGRFLGSLKDALVAASREDTGRLETHARERGAEAPQGGAIVPLDEATRIVQRGQQDAPSPSAAEAAREARAARTTTEPLDPDSPPTTRVVRAAAAKTDDSGGSRTTLVRGKVQVARGAFDEDPVVGWLVVVGGPGIGQFRPIFEGNNSMGRAESNRIPIDFGDDAISAEEQAYIRYDSAERSFLFVPNLAKTNVVSLNEKRPTGAVELTQMDVITMGRTQLVFVPFCGPDFDWSALQGET